jgi:cytochrome c oxidase assembly protein subunit 15
LNTEATNHINTADHNHQGTKDIAGWLSGFLMLALILSVVTVVLSSYIRLTESGIGCEPWPLCYRKYHNSESAIGINVLTNKGGDSPYRVERIAHRIVASSLGLVIFILFILSRKERYRTHIGAFIPSTLMVLAILLALIGPIHPYQPLPILILSNFVGGFLITMMIYHLYRSLKIKNELPFITTYRQHIRTGMVLIIVQIIWGGWTSANFSGASCTSLFDCNVSMQENLEIAASVNPVSFLSLNDQSMVIIENKMATIQLIHHILAAITLIYFIYIVGLLVRSERGSDQRLAQHCLRLLSLLVGQF